MSNFVNIIKTKDLKITELHKDGLYFPYEALTVKNGNTHAFSIEQRTVMGMPDCKIGNFYLNIWFRPKKAISNDFEGYKNKGVFARAVILCLKSHGYEFLGWINEKDSYTQFKNEEKQKNK